MQTYSFNQFVPSLSDKTKAQIALDGIMALHPETDKIIIDLSGMIAMTTICARIIFGGLYVNLGPKLFSENILMKNVEESIRIVIRWGISKELEQDNVQLN